MSPLYPTLYPASESALRMFAAARIVPLMHVPAELHGQVQLVPQYYCGTTEGQRRLEPEDSPDARFRLVLGMIPERVARALGGPEGGYYLGLEDADGQVVEHEVRYVGVWLSDPGFPADLAGEITYWPFDGTMLPSIVGIHAARNAKDLEAIRRALEELRSGKVFRRSRGAPPLEKSSDARWRLRAKEALEIEAGKPPGWSRRDTARRMFGIENVEANARALTRYITRLRKTEGQAGGPN